MFNQLIFNRLLKSLENLKTGSLTITAPDQTVYEFQGGIKGAVADITIKDWDVLGNLATKGDIGFAEDYKNGLWDTTDLIALLTVSMQNKSNLNSFFTADKLRNLFYQISYLFKRNSVHGSRKNIHAHYDLGNDFYKLWLDPTMTYSSALFKGEGENLQTAQENKYNRIIENLNSDSGNLLEIGCGWGGFADQALSRGKDFEIKGITLSDEQMSFAKNRLGNKASICLEDYRHQEGKYDHIVSIEMFEAVGEKFWPVYFEKMASLLKKNGKAVVQTITIGDQDFNRYKNQTDFLRTYIFPGGLLPSPSKFNQKAKRAGLKPVNSFEFGQDYAKTLEIWLKNFDNVYESVKETGFDDGFIRLWRFYLAGCAAAFKSGYTNVRQIELQHA